MDTDIGMKTSLLFTKDYITSKDIEEANAKLYELLDIPNDTEKHELFDNILKNHFTIKPVDHMTEMSDSTFTDMQLDTWCKQQGHTMGGRDLLYQMLSNPTTDIELLKKRQKSIQKVQTNWKHTVEKLALLEKEVLWIYTLPETFHDIWPIPLLFPSFPIIRRINESANALHMYHTYRIWLTPLLQLVIPIMSILSPWLYLRYRMKWKLSIIEYFQLIKFVFLQSIAGIDWKQKITRYGYIMIYISIFFYGLIQTIDISRMLHIVKKKLLDRMEKIRTFVDESHALLSQWNIELTDVAKPDIPSGMAGVYAIWMNQSLRSDITKLIQRFYEFDVSLSCKLLVTNEKWAYTKYSQSRSQSQSQGGIIKNMTMFQGIRNPLLNNKQVSNPVSLIKNIIITGPNAAGKSTYVRSIGANIICSQTLGICCAKIAKITPVHAILSYMRIRDLIGDKSLFETEVAHCSRILQTALDIQKDGKTAVIFFDEPMHSTPALEGEAAAYAVLEYLGNLKNIRTVVTSHYHRLTSLALKDDTGHKDDKVAKINDNKNDWVNLCMDAIYDKPNDIFSFPYRIRSGASFQSIALELLRGTEKLPASVVQNAIKFKSSINKLETNEP